MVLWICFSQNHDHTKHCLDSQDREKIPAAKTKGIAKGSRFRDETCARNYP
jgi:hypothetical protein